MKRLVLSACMIFVAMSSRVNAQEFLNATVPFSFRVGSSEMPAGDYIIRQSHRILTVTQVGGGGVFALALPASRKKAPATGLLEFERYGDSYFLSNVWSPFSKEGLALPKSRQEKEIAKRMGSGQLAALRTK